MTWLEVSLLCVVMCLLFVVMSSIDDMDLAGRWVIVSCADVDVDVDRFIWRDSDLMLRILYTVSCDFVVHKSKEATNRKAIPVRQSRAPFSNICNQITYSQLLLEQISTCFVQSSGYTNISAPRREI
jgi:hypothetical protein